MRLMAIGLKVHAATGDVVTPALQKARPVVTGECTVKRLLLVNVATSANCGTALLGPFSRVHAGETGGGTVLAYSGTNRCRDGTENAKGILPGGSLFEEAVMALGDACRFN